MTRSPLSPALAVAETSQVMTVDLIARYLRHLKGAGKAKTTRDAVEYWLRRLDRELPMGLYEAVTEELEDWQSMHRCRKTQAVCYSHITGFYRWACHPDREIGLEWDPSAGLVRPRVPARRPRPVSTEQLAVARAQLRQPFRLYVELAAFAGLRAIEISRLERRDVTKEELFVRRGKGDKARTVLVSPDLWRTIQPLPLGPIARTVRGTQQTSPEVYKSTNNALRRLGLPVTLHQFRHWYATYLLDEGAEVTAVQEAMGHASLETTAGYLALTSRQRANLSRAVCALPTLAPTVS